MVAYYKNSKGEIINFLKSPYRTVDTDWYDADWSESSSGYTKTIKIDVFSKKGELTDNMNHLYDVLAYDSDNDLYGRLYVNGTFLPCRLKKSKKTKWAGCVYAVVELTFIAPALDWITEECLQFFSQTVEQANEGLNFPFDCPFNFTLSKRGYAAKEIDGTCASDFQMIIYGPCVNPRILINGYPYEVYCTLESNEYVLIDSKLHTVTKYLANGTTANLYDQRNLEYSIFEKIPSGSLAINWSGDFGFDIYLRLRRREARW